MFDDYSCLNWPEFNLDKSSVVWNGWHVAQCICVFSYNGFFLQKLSTLKVIDCVSLIAQPSQKKNSIGLAFYFNLNAFRYLSFDVLFRKWTKLSTPRLWHESCHNGWFNPIFHGCDFRYGSSTLRLVQKSLTLHRRIASILTIGSYQFRLFDSLTSCRKLLARLSPILVNKTNVLIRHSLLNW